MRMVDRYVLREVSSPSLLALTILVFLMLMTQALRLADLVLGSALGLLDGLEIGALLLPSFLVLGIPVALLFGVLAGLARMAAERELLAMSLLGIRERSLLRPLVVLAAVMFVACFSLSSFVAPAAMSVLKSRVLYLARENLAAAVKAGGFTSIAPGLTVYAEYRHGRVMGNVFAVDRRQEGRELIVMADKGRIRSLPKELALELELERGELYATEQAAEADTVASFERAVFKLDVGRQVERRTRFIRDSSTMGLFEILEAMNGDRGVTREEGRMLSLAAQRKLALPAACLVFVFLGLALGPTVKSRARGASALAAAAIVVVYYVLFRTGDHMVAAGSSPAWVAAWMPDIAMLILAGIVVKARRRRVP